MRYVLALIASVAILASSSAAFAGIPSGHGNPSNCSWDQTQAASCAGSIWGGLCSYDSKAPAQQCFNACWVKYCGSSAGCPTCPDKTCGELCQDKLFLELLLCILFELHQHPTHSGCC